MPDQIIEYTQANQDHHLNQLFEFLRIPSISTLPEHKPDVLRAAEWLVEEMNRIGLNNVQLIPTKGHPLVYGEWLEAGPDAPTVLVYGHYDVQPVDPIELWESQPFEPEIREGKIYARGAADDKGQMFSHLKAVEAILAMEGKLPVNIKLLFEGEEETGTTELQTFVPAHKDLLATDLVLVSDTGFMEPGKPLIIYSLRGVIGVEVHVSGPITDLHSGAFGGTVHNPAQALAEIIVALHDENGKVAIPGFYDKVRPLTTSQKEFMAQRPLELEEWQRLTGLEKPWGEPEYDLIERIAARPTCEVNGIWGGFQGDGSKTIIPAEAHAKFTMRLVPDQDPIEIGQLFAGYINDIAPDDLQVHVELGKGGGYPVVVATDSLEIKAASQAYERVWGLPPDFMPGGGSIPAVAAFSKVLDIPVVLMGFSVSGCGIHAPNEWFLVEHFFKGIDTIIHYYYLLSESRSLQT
jgi:acetylornithine deacetylase/succinyl-diaminopimelate desuccinylase-like protein